ncbi:MAG: Nif11 family protein [Candidatus Hydrogenedentes bacterium]|nr:Nif11 family protein [Candidatus Hydrogenedentota bacterium]
MSLDGAFAFLKLAETDEDLAADLARLRGREALVELTRIAAGRGLVFSVEEYREAVVQLADGALSDEALDEVRRELGME